MNRRDIADLVGLIDTYSPGFASEDRLRATAAVWSVQLQDVDPDTATATAAVHAHYATETRWIMPTDVRRYAASRAGVLPPDPETARAQLVALNSWYGPVGSGPDPATRPPVHPAVQAALKVVGLESALTMDRFDWRAAYAPHAVAFEKRALTPGGIPAARAELDTPRTAPRAAVAPAPEPEDGERLTELRQHRAANTARLDQAIAELGDDARFLIPRGASLGNRYGQAALVQRLGDYGFDRDPDEAMRKARLEIGRHADSAVSTDLEARRTAALRALTAMIEDAS